MHASLISLARASSSYPLGVLVGRIVFTIPLLLGVLKCAQVARRERANTKALIGLMLVLIAWVAGSLPDLFSGVDPAAPLPELLLLAPALGLMLIGSTIAALGLAEMRADRQRWSQGSAQAGWALVITCACLLTVGVATYRKLEQPGGGGSPVRGEPISGPARSQSVEEFNFRIDDIPAGWVLVDPKQWAAGTVLVLTRARPSATLSVTAMKLGQVDLTVEALAEFARVSLKSVAERVDIGPPEQLTLGQTPGLAFSSSASIEQQRFSYRHWVGQRNGFAYQLVMSAEQRDTSRTELEQLASELYAGFHQIDPDRVCVSH